jgi:putative ABC transport system permease protein
MVLLALFGGVALTLSAIGIYGVLAFGVAQRSREFGIRQALGADRQTILGLVLKQGLRTAGAGIAIGLALAVVLTTYLRSLLFGVGPHDVVVYGLVTTLLFAVAILACYVPALRATRVEPTVALRES